MSRPVTRTQVHRVKESSKVPSPATDENQFFKTLRELFQNEPETASSLVKTLTSKARRSDYDGYGADVDGNYTIGRSGESK